MNRIIESWLRFGMYILIICLSIFLIFISYKYIRGLCKRICLIKRLKKICKTNQYQLTYSMSAYFSIFKTAKKNEMLITAKEKSLNIRFIACLKRKDTYTFTDIDSYYTSNNFNPIFVSHGHPSAFMVLNKNENKKLRLPITFQSKNEYIKTVHEGIDIRNEGDRDTTYILCINPLPVNVQIVKTNRPEQVFDGEEFKGCVIYSGKGLCNYLNHL